MNLKVSVYDIFTAFTTRFCTGSITGTCLGTCLLLCLPLGCLLVRGRTGFTQNFLEFFCLSPYPCRYPFLPVLSSLPRLPHSLYRPVPYSASRPDRILFFLPHISSESAALRASTSSFLCLSCSSNCFASLTIFLTSFSASFVEAVMVIFCSFPVPRSFAETFRIPEASISNVTSIWGTPRGAGGMPTRLNCPRLTLSARHGPFALEHVNRHGGLVIGRC